MKKIFPISAVGFLVLYLALSSQIKPLPEPKPEPETDTKVAKVYLFFENGNQPAWLSKVLNDESWKRTMHERYHFRFYDEHVKKYDHLKAMTSERPALITLNKDDGKIWAGKCPETVEGIEGKLK